MSTFGVGSIEKQGGVGSEMEPPLKSGSSPVKRKWWQKALDPLDLKNKLFGKKKNPAAAAAPEVAAAGGGGDGSHTHGADGSTQLTYAWQVSAESPHGEFFVNSDVDPTTASASYGNYASSIVVIELAPN